MDTFIDYIKGNEQQLLSRKGLIHLFSHQRKRPVYSKDTAETYPAGTIFFVEQPTNIDKSKYGYIRDGQFKQLSTSTFNPSAPFSVADVITLPKGVIANHTGESIKTIIGSFIANYTCIASIVGDLIPYVNGIWNIDKVEQMMAQKIMEGSMQVKQYLQYIDQGTRLAHFGELFQPTMSERSVAVPKYITKRRDELLKEHANELKDARVVSAIEKELIQMYKDYIGDDPVAGYLEASKKSYNTHAKTMHLMVGGVSNFGGNSEDVVVIPRSLNEGWDPQYFEAMANEIRKGAYSRSVETQDGGAMTKRINRALQDIHLVNGDCKSTQGVSITFDSVVKPSNFLGRYVIRGSSLVLITTDNLHTFKTGQTVKLRSPIYCKHKAGICTTCMGNIFKTLEITEPGSLTCVVTSAMMGASMAAMHVEAIDVREINLEQAIV